MFFVKSSQAMSRKKTLKGKGNSSPTATLPSKQNGKSCKGSSGAEMPVNGVVLPNRPSLSNSSEFYDIAFKVMLVGDSGVGKTCLLVRFKDGAFLAGSFISTVGIDFRDSSLEAVESLEENLVSGLDSSAMTSVEASMDSVFHTSLEALQTSASDA
ncbi:ras-related protein Rab-26-like [Protopterus annectens]|uniref:ras-related protein Rab-26-like n=1 Tax=Protopterus annectens TaxID=7888 RepID=UPI001CF9B794|nr:ras-related protein Rab-26-like [Protopterus annectens]